MKKFKFKVGFAAIVVLALFSCSKEEIVKSGNSGGIDVTSIATIPTDKPVVVWEWNGSLTEPDCYEFYCDCTVIDATKVNGANQQAINDFEAALGNAQLVEDWFNSSDALDWSNVREDQLDDLKDGTTMIKEFSGIPYYHIVYPTATAPGGSNRPNYLVQDIY